jgi:hypothetical protein
MCVCPAACRRTHTSYQPKIWRGLLISPGLGTKLGGDPKCWPQALPTGPPMAPPTARPLLLLSSLDQSARDYFTIVLWNSPGQRWVASPEWGWTARNAIARQSFARHFWQEINCSTQNLSTARIQLILAKLDSSKWQKKWQLFATVKCKRSNFFI